MNYEQYTGKKKIHIYNIYYNYILKVGSRSNLHMDCEFLLFSAELKSILGHGGKRKAPELLSDGPSFKRQANIHSHLLVSLEYFF